MERKFGPVSAETLARTEAVDTTDALDRLFDSVADSAVPDQIDLPRNPGGHS